MHDTHVYGRQENQELYALIERDYKIFAEYRLFEEAKLRGIFVIPSHTNSLLWFGVIFTYSGIYARSVFRFSLILPDKYPNVKTLPKFIFAHDPMHPHVCPFTHSFNIAKTFPEWRTDEHHLWHIFKFIQMSFNDIKLCVRGFSGEFSNSFAATLYQKKRKEYILRIKQIIEQCNAHIFDAAPTDDPHYIIFENYNPSKHKALLDNLQRNQFIKFGHICEPQRSKSINSNAGNSLVWKIQKSVEFQLGENTDDDDDEDNQDEDVANTMTTTTTTTKTSNNC